MKLSGFFGGAELPELPEPNESSTRRVWHVPLPGRDDFHAEQVVMTETPSDPLPFAVWLEWLMGGHGERFVKSSKGLGAPCKFALRSEADARVKRLLGLSRRELEKLKGHFP